MRKYISLLSFILVLLLSACTFDCTEETRITSPYLTGYTKNVLETELIRINLNYPFSFFEGINPEIREVFSKYVCYEI